MPRNPHLRRAHRRPGLEPLEGRQLLATFLVTNVEDSGPGSLRQALLDTRNDISLDGSKIDFAIPGGGIHTIEPSSSLPPIDRRVAIDGTTQPGYAGTPLVAIDGSRAGPADGLTFSFGSGGSISGLAIERFSGSGIQSFGTTVTIRSNFLGVDPTGRADGGNANSGISMYGSNGSTVGGAADADGNVIGGNGETGINLGTATSTLVAHNFIGTDRAGRGGLGNLGDGVYVGPSSTSVSVVSNTISNNGRLAVDDKGTATLVDRNIESNNGQRIANLTIQASTTTLDTATGRVELLTYSIVNQGPAEAPSATLSVESQNFLNTFDFVPAPPIVQQLGTQASRGTVNPNATLNGFGDPFVQFGTLAPGDSAVVTLTLRVVRSGHDTLVANLSYGMLTPDQSVTTRTAINAAGTVDLAVTALPVPAVVKAGAPLAFTFLITNRDAEFVTFPTVALDLTRLNGASIVSVSASQGTLAPLPGRADFYTGTLTTTNDSSPYPTPGGLAAGASATVTVVVVPTRPGPVYATLASSYAGDVDPDPSNNLALAGVRAQLQLAITGAQLQPDSGPIRSVVLAFDAPLARARAQDVRNYHLTTNSGRTRIGIRSAVYDAVARRVTLLLSRALARAGTPIRLEVGGPGTPGLAAPDGSKLPNGSYSATLTRG